MAASRTARAFLDNTWTFRTVDGKLRTGDRIAPAMVNRLKGFPRRRSSLHEEMYRRVKFQLDSMCRRAHHKSEDVTETINTASRKPPLLLSLTA